jgi:ribosomal protein S18 acetylase RimI-like enzyme
MTMRLTIPDTPDDTHRDAVIAPLRAYNVEQAGDPAIQPVAIMLTDDAGRHVGGLWGKTSYDWMFIELLAVPPEYRGGEWGTRLMQEAEAIARARGCTGMWLDTYDFQARGFYEKLGFEVFGALDDHPIGHQRFFLRKRLT